MEREEYIEKALQIYSLVAVLSRKNGYEVLRLRNRNNGKELVLRSFPKPVATYGKL